MIQELDSRWERSDKYAISKLFLLIFFKCLLSISDFFCAFFNCAISEYEETVCIINTYILSYLLVMQEGVSALSRMPETGDFSRKLLGWHSVPPLKDQTEKPSSYLASVFCLLSSVCFRRATLSLT